MQQIYKKYLITATSIWVVSFLALAVLYAYLVVPQGGEIAQLNSKLSLKDTELANARDANKPETRKRLATEIKDLNGRIGEFACGTADAGKIAVDISQIANSLRLKEFSCRLPDTELSKEVAGAKHLGSVMLQISFKGTFLQFAVFVNNLERHIPVVFVNTYSIQLPTDSSGDNTISLSCRAFVCSEKIPNQTAGKAVAAMSSADNRMR
jgi:hypothetical protein